MGPWRFCRVISTTQCARKMKIIYRIEREYAGDFACVYLPIASASTRWLVRHCVKAPVPPLLQRLRQGLYAIWHRLCRVRLARQSICESWRRLSKWISPILFIEEKSMDWDGIWRVEGQLGNCVWRVEYHASDVYCASV